MDLAADVPRLIAYPVAPVELVAVHVTATWIVVASCFVHAEMAAATPVGAARVAEETGSGPADAVDDQAASAVGTITATATRSAPTRSVRLPIRKDRPARRQPKALEAPQQKQDPGSSNVVSQCAQDERNASSG